MGSCRLLTQRHRALWGLDSCGCRTQRRPFSPAVTNPCDRKKCEWLCLLSPSGPVCTCPNGKRLDNGTCVLIPSPTASAVGGCPGG